MFAEDLYARYRVLVLPDEVLSVSVSAAYQHVGLAFLNAGLAAKAEVGLVDPVAAEALAEEHPHPQTVLFLGAPVGVEIVELQRSAVDPVVELLVLADEVVALEVVPCLPCVDADDSGREHVFPSQGCTPSVEG